MKKIAIIGSGISGVSSAYYLNKLGYEVTLYESGHYFGGHTNTIDTEVDNKKLPIDTGFLVHNDRTYPNLIKFFEELGIKAHPSDMTFSVDHKKDGIVWAGSNLLTVFAQFKNLFSLRFFRFLKEVLRFNRNAQDYLDSSKNNLDKSLGDLLKEHNYSSDFQKWYMLPMGGCIWSTPTNEMLQFPAYTFLRFSMNHGLLQIFNRPQWKTVVGGCRTYVEKALEVIDQKYLNEPVLKVERKNESVLIESKNYKKEFDYCVVTTHPPQALNFLDNIDHCVKDILKNFKYQPNKAVLHIDENILPKNKIAWSAWNYTSAENMVGDEAVSVSYLINKLQPLDTEKQIIVTLNPVTEINKTKIFKEIEYEHPLFNSSAIKAQDQIQNIQGQQGIFYAGAWLRYGFHEDGILSAKMAVNKILEQDGKKIFLDVL